MKKLIKWNVGEGNIVAEYDSELDGTIKFSSDIINEDIDREQYVTIRAENELKRVKVTQLGKRELFISKSGEFVTTDGQFKVLKKWDI